MSQPKSRYLWGSRHPAYLKWSNKEGGIVIRMKEEMDGKTET